MLSMSLSIKIPIHDLVNALAELKGSYEDPKIQKTDAKFAAFQPAIVHANDMTSAALAPVQLSAVPAGVPQPQPTAVDPTIPAGTATAERSREPARRTVTWDSEISELHPGHEEYVKRTKWKVNDSVRPHPVLDEAVIGALQQYVVKALDPPRLIPKLPGSVSEDEDVPKLRLGAPTGEVPGLSPPSVLVPEASGTAEWPDTAAEWPVTAEVPTEASWPTHPPPPLAMPPPPPGPSSGAPGGPPAVPLAQGASIAGAPCGRPNPPPGLPVPAGLPAGARADISPGKTGQARAGVAHPAGKPAPHKAAPGWPAPFGRGQPAPQAQNAKDCKQQ